MPSTRLGARHVTPIRRRVFRHFQRLSPAFHDDYTSGRVISRQTSDVDAIYEMLESGFTRALIDMGYRDAMEMEDELRAFIFDQPMATLYAPAHLKLALDR